MLRSNDNQFSRQTFVIDRVGEMPSGAASIASSAVGSPAPGSGGGSAGSSIAQLNRGASPSIGNGAATSTPLSGFPAYEVEDATSRTGTPPPIKVTRTKKKTKAASSSGKKKRTSAVAADTLGDAS